MIRIGGALLAATVALGTVNGSLTTASRAFSSTPSPISGWSVEHDRATTAEIERTSESTITLRYTLGAGPAANQFAALVGAIPGGLAAFERVTFTARANRPLRIGVQLRPASGNNPPRWQRSVFLDQSPRTVTIPFADMRPIPRDVTEAIPLVRIDALMFVIDTNNTFPGSSGAVTVSGVLFDAADQAEGGR